MRKTAAGSLLILLLVNPLALVVRVDGCGAGSYTSPLLGGGTTSKPPNQYTTPQLATVATSSCGHSMYYFKENNPGSGIIGGINALPNQYPWVVRLRIISSGFLTQCTGTLVTDKWIITTATCAKMVTVPSDITAFIADWDRNQTDTGENPQPISTITVHPNFNPTTMDYDFALLKLPVTLDFGANWKTQKICLPSSCSDGCGIGINAYIAGWGSTMDSTDGNNFPGDKSYSQILQSAYVKIADWSDCKQRYAALNLTTSTLSDRMICAGYTGGGADACYGDQGTPLMGVESGYYKLCGIYSFTGQGCARANMYGVYAKTCTILDWIKSTAI